MASGSPMITLDLTTHKLSQYQESSSDLGSDALLLFEHAIGERDEIAWASIYELYSPLVRFWTARSLSGIRLDFLEIESLVNAAFARFFQSFTAEKLACSVSLASILCYLKLCTRTVVFNEVRSQARRRESSLDGMALIDQDEPMFDDSASAAIESVSAQELWRVMQEELRGEDERLLLYLTCICGMKPGEISSEYQQYFPVVIDVYRLKQSIRERLARSRRIQAYLAPVRSEAPTSEGEEETCEVPVRLIVTQPVSLPLSPQAESAQAVPQCPGQSEMGNAVKYRQQVNFCGKPRCRKCQQGIGHGPYWYSYRVVDGRTISTYIGKELSGAHRHDPNQEKPVRYHFQKTFCGKKNCRRCQEGTGHGPYWFGYHIADGRSIRRYIGKSLPAGIVVEGSVIDEDREHVSRTMSAPQGGACL